VTDLIWGLPVVAKYLFGGLSAGAFVTYYLWQGFGLARFRPLAKLAWISAAVFGLVIPIPIFAHLGQPARFANLLTAFHWSSPMSWAGPILLAYIVVVLINGRFFFFSDVVLAHRAATGVRKRILRLLLITRPPAGEIPIGSQVWLKITGALGFILVLFFGYSGLELGIIPSKPLWANPINPLMFLLTGIISGIAWVVILWIALERRRGAPSDAEAGVLRSLLLPGLIGLFLALNAISYVSLSFSPPEVQPAVLLLASGDLATLFVGVGLVLGGLFPALLFVGNAARAVPLRSLAAVSASLTLVGTFAQKYGFLAAGQFYEAPTGGTFASVWPTSAEIVEFLALLALVYFLFQLALWISPWRKAVSVSGEPAPPTEVPA
jgi:tetrathionate reductase subunit C